MTRHIQRGSTLVISLIILIILMLLGVTAMVTSNTAFKLAGNLQFENNAMNSAEATLSQVENWLATGSIPSNHVDFLATPPVTASTTGRYPIRSGVDPANMTWDDTNSAVTGQGRYIVELMSSNNVLIGSSVTIGGPLSYACNRVNTFRISARGASARGAAKIVQSYYSVLSTC